MEYSFKKKGDFLYYKHNKSGIIFFSNKEKFSEWKGSKDKNVFFLVKDNFWVENFPTTASSSFLESFFPPENSTVVKLLLESGYKLLGKSCLDEFACGGLGIFSNKGEIFNPHDKSRLVGGSSSGSAFSVSKDIVKFSIGHDAGDSVRRPSSYCGIIGFKPSYGSISRYGIIPMASSFDTVGIMSKDINMISSIFKILHKIDYKDLTTLAFNKIKSKYLLKKNKLKKIAVIKGIEEFINKEYYQMYLDFLNKISDNNLLTVEKIDLPIEIKKSLQISYLILCSSEISSHLNSLNGLTYGCNNDNDKTIIEKRSARIGKWTKERIIIGNYFLKKNDLLEKANSFRLYLVQWLKKLFKEYDFLIFPGTEGAAPKLSDLTEEKNLRKSEWIDNLLLLANLGGNPSINLPLGKIENDLPVSINIDSSWNNEEELIKFSEYLITKIKD